jgi:hypothetical protein
MGISLNINGVAVAMMWIVLVVPPILLLWPHKHGGHGETVLECMLVC